MTLSRFRPFPLLLALFPIAPSPAVASSTTPPVPADFPAFGVPGHDADMDTVRQLYWLHYRGSGPKATLWDEWLPSPSLWPAVGSDAATGAQPAGPMRSAWSATLSDRPIDAEGYVATQQHNSIAHPLGWPFPAWHQGRHGGGWHFSFNHVPGPPWRPNDLNTTAGWTLSGAADAGIDRDGWNLRLETTGALVTAPPQRVLPLEAPFLQIRWSADGLAPDAQPFIEWTTADAPGFSSERRIYFSPPSSPSASPAPAAAPSSGRGRGAAAGAIDSTLIPVSRHPAWKGEITQLRLGFGNRAPGATVILQALFSTYDTRHNVNNLVYPVGCATYFHWTRDLNFLRDNVQRMRTALRYAMDEFHTPEEKVVLTTWVGHDGRSGFTRNAGPQGESKEIHTGQGIGSNYWDLLPFGHKDTYATIRLYHCLRVMAGLEREIAAHPEWNLPAGFLRLDPDALDRHAAAVKETGNRLFWSDATGRFVPAVDIDGKKPDYGLTFLNLEAIHYGFATPEHAASIMSWITGARAVAGDTAQTTDIYHWRFAPRATTRRNLDYYTWVWNSPESIPWGDQVQDGGAVLGFSYHDLMARLDTLGPDNAWQRLREILAWFRDTEAAGGYRAYYDGKRPGTLQGGGTAGGLGLDQEFFESVLVPQVMLDGFLGFSPTGDGFRLTPHLPADWPALTITRIALHDQVLSIRATSTTLEIRKEAGGEGGSGGESEPEYVHLPEGEWTAEALTADSRESPTPLPLKKRESDGAWELPWFGTAGVRLKSAAK